MIQIENLKIVTFYNFTEGFMPIYLKFNIRQIRRKM